MSAANGHVTYIQYNSTANWRLWLGLEQRQTAPFFFFMVSCCFPWQVERLRSELRVSKPKLPAETLAKLEELRAEAADIERDSGLNGVLCVYGVYVCVCFVVWIFP